MEITRPGDFIVKIKYVLGNKIAAQANKGIFICKDRSAIATLESAQSQNCVVVIGREL